jgi:signal transduction histidine kinase/DNA-binding NarL/FixJ family response regulator
VTHRIFNYVIPFSFAITISNSVFLALKGEKKARILTVGILGFLMFAVHDWLVGSWILKWNNLMMHWAFLFLLSFLLAILHAHVRELLAVKTRQNLADARDRAIARTTQSFAHDVRKPFSMFKNIIQVVEATENPAQVKEVLKLTLPEVNQAMASVEGMIDDVMQIGSDSKMHTEVTSPESLIESSLGELFRIYPEADIQISYDLSHRHRVMADSLRIGRVFSNILGNAIQAMQEKGNLWFKTFEKNGFTEFRLGNSGSCIPNESLPKLFDVFFTSGKKGGTGLGLAIAKKVVEAHGGEIRCESGKTKRHPKGYVEFIFTLPSSGELVPTRSESLPRTSKEIQSAIAALRIASTNSAKGEPNASETQIEAQLLGEMESLQKKGLIPMREKLPVLVIEDEAVYRNGLLSLVERSAELASKVHMSFAKSDKDATRLFQEKMPFLVIADVDLGPSSENGIEIVKSFRDKGFAGHICVHSNRFLSGDNKAALAAGADTVLPKPLGRAHFLKLLMACLPEEESEAAKSAETPDSAEREVIQEVGVGMRHE